MSEAAGWTLGILAGGASRRMGRDKALIELNGRSFLEHVRDRCAHPGGDVLVSTGPDSRAIAGSWRCVPDVLGAGPLSGIHALCRAVGSGWLVVVPCDMPFLDRSHLEPLVAAARSSGASLAMMRPEVGHPRPFPLAIEASSGVAAVEKMVAAATLRIIGLADVLEVRRVDPPADPQALGNVNTPQDLEFAAKFFATSS